MKSVFSIEDLGKFPAGLAVIGFPVKHSVSPEMHQPALDEAGIDVRYIRLEVAPGKVSEAFARMRETGFLGCNVTVPHKLEAMEACDEVSEEARLLGAVNTISFREGKTIGTNTDGPGLAAAVEESFGRPLGSLKTMVIGAGGGAGRAIAMMCALRGVPELWLVNRTTEKLVNLLDQARELSPGTRLYALGHDDASLAEAAGNCDLIINATSLGMQDDDPPVLPEGALHAGQFVYDAVYHPRETELLNSARKADCLTANGLAMLLHQGALAFQTWFPDTNPLETMRHALAQGD